MHAWNKPCIKSYFGIVLDDSKIGSLQEYDWFLWSEFANLDNKNKKKKKWNMACSCLFSSFSLFQWILTRRRTPITMFESFWESPKQQREEGWWPLPLLTTTSKQARKEASVVRRKESEYLSRYLLTTMLSSYYECGDLSSTTSDYYLVHTLRCRWVTNPFETLKGK